jgi:hypothetical protein
MQIPRFVDLPLRSTSDLSRGRMRAGEMLRQVPGATTRTARGAETLMSTTTGHSTLAATGTMSLLPEATGCNSVETLQVITTWKKCLSQPVTR